MIDTQRLSVQDLIDGYHGKEFKPSEVAHSYLENIEKKNGELNAFFRKDLKERA